YRAGDPRIVDDAQNRPEVRFRVVKQPCRKGRIGHVAMHGQRLVSLGPELPDKRLRRLMVIREAEAHLPALRGRKPHAGGPDPATAACDQQYFRVIRHHSSLRSLSENTRRNYLPATPCLIHRSKPALALHPPSGSRLNAVGPKGLRHPLFFRPIGEKQVARRLDAGHLLDRHQDHMATREFGPSLFQEFIAIAGNLLLIRADDPRGSGKLEAALAEDVYEAVADLGIDPDVADTDRRGDVRDDQRIWAAGREDLLWR